MPRSPRLIAALAGSALLVGGAAMAAAAPGVVTEYSAGITPNSDRAIIAAGHGGIMWFSNENAPSVGTITTGNPAPGPPPPPVPTPTVTPSGPTDVVNPVAQNLRSTTRDGGTTITFRLRYAATGTYSFRLETGKGKVLPLLAGSDIAGVKVGKTTTRAVVLRGARKGKVVSVKVVMKGTPAKGSALRAIIAGKKGSRTTETIRV